ncbi:hypothetical protein [Chryseobacterium sp. HSC-36S06]|uniref:hypothetical protein n=1 Tax=Chryseobacterium sp. HSC-36S06 TaxID=2910970 RepID=UPI00209CAC70|nr:hypothetical protein [Chryseobacterium sp. HSC-36S06]MCP2037693.1 hypothetical protein [Chryseobacterium sp. HSC-36S06]
MLDQIEKHGHIFYFGLLLVDWLFFSISNSYVLPSYRNGFLDVVLKASAMKLLATVVDIKGCKVATKSFPTAKTALLTSQKPQDTGRSHARHLPQQVFVAFSKSQFVRENRGSLFSELPFSGIPEENDIHLKFKVHTYFNKKGYRKRNLEKAFSLLSW